MHTASSRPWGAVSHAGPRMVGCAESPPEAAVRGGCGAGGGRRAGGVRPRRDPRRLQRLAVCVCVAANQEMRGSLSNLTYVTC